jgi:hypothetical protein
MDSVIELLRTLVVQVVVHVEDSSQATDQDPNRHPGRPLILRLTASTVPPTDVLARLPIEAGSPEASAMSSGRMIVLVSVRLTFVMSPSAKSLGVLRLDVTAPSAAKEMGATSSKVCSSKMSYCEPILWKYYSQPRTERVRYLCLSPHPCSAYSSQVWLRCRFTYHGSGLLYLLVVRMGYAGMIGSPGASTYSCCSVRLFSFASKNTVFRCSVLRRYTLGRRCGSIACMIDAA